MKMNNNKNYLYHIIVFFIMFLFAACLIMNVFFCSSYNLYELLDKTTAIETWAISDSSVSNEDGDNAVYFKHLFLKRNTPYTKTIMKNISPIPTIADIPKELNLRFVRIIVFLCFFLSLSILLSGKWTLVNLKIRLDI